TSEMRKCAGSRVIRSEEAHAAGWNGRCSTPHGMTRFTAVVGILATAGALSLCATDADARPRAIVVRTASVVPDPNGHLLCIVRADSAVEIDVATRIMGATGQNLLEFGSTLIVSPIGTDDHRYHVEQDTGTTSDDARWCEVSVDRARKNDLR